MKASIALFTIFYDLSVSRNPLSKAKNREIWKIRALDFFKYKSTCDLTDVSASIDDRKRDDWPFDTIDDILWCLRLVQSLIKGRNALIWRKRKPTHMRLSETDRLSGIVDHITDIINKMLLKYFIFKTSWNIYFNNNIYLNVNSIPPIIPKAAKIMLRMFESMYIFPFQDRKI